MADLIKKQGSGRQFNWHYPTREEQRKKSRGSLQKQGRNARDDLGITEVQEGKGGKEQ